MTHACAKCGVMIKCSKDKKKVMRVTARFVVHIKKCARVTQHQSTAAETSYVKEDDNMRKEQRNLLCAGQGSFFQNLTQGKKNLTVQAMRLM